MTPPPPKSAQQFASSSFPMEMRLAMRSDDSFGDRSVSDNTELTTFIRRLPLVGFGQCVVCTEVRTVDETMFVRRRVRIGWR